MFLIPRLSGGGLSLNIDRKGRKAGKEKVQKVVKGESNRAGPHVPN